MGTSGERASKVAGRGRRGSRGREEAVGEKSLRHAGRSPTRPATRQHDDAARRLPAEERVHSRDGATLALVPVTADVGDSGADRGELRGEQLVNDGARLGAV